MKRNFLLIFVLCTLFTHVSFAQVINGDLNHNDVLDVGDVTMVIDGYLTGETETIQTGGNPFTVDNSFVVGTWYNSAKESVTFNADGTTDFANGGTYKFLSTQGYILFYNASGVPFYALRVLEATSECLVVLPAGSSTPELYTAIPVPSADEAVDLGLSVKWAPMNVGALAPEDSGNLFAWGETKPKDTYNWSTYTWCKGSNDTMTKYCTDPSKGTVDNKTVLDLSDDAAYANWGSTWRMPTDAEWEEMLDKCTWEWTTQNGVNGRKVTGPNGNSIFLPAAGYRYDGTLSSVGSYGSYWSSSLGTLGSPDYSFSACDVIFDSDDVQRHYWSSRYYGNSVRAVCP